MSKITTDIIYKVSPTKEELIKTYEGEINLMKGDSFVLYNDVTSTCPVRNGTYVVVHREWEKVGNEILRLKVYLFKE